MGVGGFCVVGRGWEAGGGGAGLVGWPFFLSPFSVFLFIWLSSFPFFDGLDVMWEEWWG
jgi:hypothetical protein